MVAARLSRRRDPAQIRDASSSSRSMSSDRQVSLQLRDGLAEPRWRPRRRWCLKIGRITAASRPCWSLHACARQSRRKRTGAARPRRAADLRRSRLQARMGVADGQLHPTTRRTSERRKSRQIASVSASPPTFRPMMSRRPLSSTAWAMTTRWRATRPLSRTFSTFASTNSYGYRPPAGAPARVHLLVKQRCKTEQVVSGLGWASTSSGCGPVQKLCTALTRACLMPWSRG